MRKSIAFRILFILSFLTFLFIVNTIISGVTNSQVQLSARLFSNSIVSLEKEQVTLAKEIGQMDTSIQTYLTGDGRTKEEVSETILQHVKLANLSIHAIANITKSFSDLAMDSVLQDSYEPYFTSTDAYLKQASAVAEHIAKGDAGSAAESFRSLSVIGENMSASETEFQKVLDNSIAHEKALIDSRVTRSTIIVWAMAALFLLSVAVTFIITLRTIIHPLKQANQSLSEIIHKLENDEGDLTVRLEHHSEDEVGQITNGINRFLVTLQSAMVSIKSSSNWIHSSAETINGKVLESKDSTTNISAALGELTVSMEEISSTIQDMNHGAQHVLEAAETIADEAKANSVQVGNMVDRAEQIRAQAHHSKAQTEAVLKDIKMTMAAAIKNSRSVDTINELTSNILDISAQTNLLALNASIEAARAGAVGKGFAVVAEEIRRLSDHSKRTANNIQGISVLVTNAVEELVDNANKMMSYISENVLVDYDHFVEVANSYKRDTDTSNVMLSRFSNESEELKRISTNMAEGVRGITLAVEEGVHVMIEAHDNTNTLLNSITTIADEVTHNREIANELHDQVNKFKRM